MEAEDVLFAILSVAEEAVLGDERANAIGRVAELGLDQCQHFFGIRRR